MKVNLVSVQYQPNPAVYKEWLTYHHALGFDKIFIFDNNITLADKKSAEPLPQMFDNVTVIKIKHRINGTQNFRWDYENLYLKDCDYYIVLDSDEYLYFNKNQTVQEFLSNYKELDWHMLLVPWKDIGSNKLIEHGKSVVSDFRMVVDDSVKGIKTGSIKNLATGERSLDCGVKTFFKTSAITDEKKDHMHYLEKTKNVDIYTEERKTMIVDIVFENAYKLDKSVATREDYREIKGENTYGCVYHYRWTYSDDIDKCLARSDSWYGKNSLLKNSWSWNRGYVPRNGKKAEGYKNRWGVIFKDNNKEDLSMVNRFKELGIWDSLKEP